jgi:hypothetical protein
MDVGDTVECIEGDWLYDWEGRPLPEPELRPIEGEYYIIEEILDGQIKLAELGRFYGKARFKKL